ncbi:MAG TPA: hypothetical protein VIB48_07855 [Acidimicrobiia bacterium]|jgi:hypothetical protein
MRTLADAALVAAFCGLLWLVVRPLTRAAAGHALVQVALYGAAAAVTTAAAVAVGAWREDLRPTVTSVGATFGGMCAFWALARAQAGSGPPRGEAHRATATEPSTPATEITTATGWTEKRAGSSGDATLPTMTRRERREARRHFGRRSRGPSAALR